MDQWMPVAQRAEDYAHQGNFVDGLPLAQRALTMAEQMAGKNSLPYAKSLCTLGLLLELKGDYPDALLTLKTSIKTTQAVDGMKSRYLMESYLALSITYQAMETSDSNASTYTANMSRAEAAARDANEIAKTYFGEDDPARRFTLVQLGQVLDDEYKSQQAADMFFEVLRLTQLANPDPNFRETIGARALLGDALIDAGRQAEGLHQLRLALDSSRALYGDQSPMTKGAEDDLRRPFGSRLLVTNLRQVLDSCAEIFRPLRFGTPYADGTTQVYSGMPLGAMQCAVIVRAGNPERGTYDCTIQNYGSAGSVRVAYDALIKEIAAALPAWQQRVRDDFASYDDNERSRGHWTRTDWVNPSNACTVQVASSIDHEDRPAHTYTLLLTVSGKAAQSKSGEKP